MQHSQLDLMKRKVILMLAFVGCTMIALTVFIVVRTNDVQRRIQSGRFQAESTCMWMALSNYVHVYGNISSSNNATVLAAITGQNSNRVVFLMVKTNRINPLGEYIDHWKTPYQLQVTTDVSFIIRSAGRNRLFGDEDDLLFERSWK